MPSDRTFSAACAFCAVRTSEKLTIIPSGTHSIRCTCPNLYTCGYTLPILTFQNVSSLYPSAARLFRSDVRVYSLYNCSLHCVAHPMLNVCCEWMRPPACHLTNNCLLLPHQSQMMMMLAVAEDAQSSRIQPPYNWCNNGVIGGRSRVELK